MLVNDKVVVVKRDGMMFVQSLDGGGGGEYDG